MVLDIKYKTNISFLMDGWVGSGAGLRDCLAQFNKFKTFQKTVFSLTSSFMSDIKCTFGSILWLLDQDGSKQVYS